MSNLLRNLITPAAIVLLTSACATGSANSAFENSETGANAPITLRVTNNNWSDAVIWAVRGGSRIRLGEVVSLRQESIDVPTTVLTGTGRVQVLVSLIGSREAYSTEEMTVYPGQVIDLQVENQLAISSWSVYQP